jgi:hypothetical protein
MSQIFGEFIEEFPREYDSLELSFTSSSQLIKQRWRNNRLSAYFVADYCSNLLPIDKDAPQGEERIKSLKDAVSYVGNELLENAMKFNEGVKPYPQKVQFGIHFLEDIDKVTAVIFTKNNISIQKFEEFQAFIDKLLSADLNDLYLQQIQETAEDENSEASGLGLLTTINDYSAKLGWKFEPDPSNPQMIAVTTMAQVVV